MVMSAAKTASEYLASLPPESGGVIAELRRLILEHLQDIPETGVSMKIADTPIEVVQTQDRMVRTARVFRPISRTNEQ